MALKYKHTLLFVDDEAPIIQSLQRLFRKENFNILTASNGNEGLEILKNLKKGPSLIISDQRMPGISGSEFLEKAKALFPESIRFLLTGYSDMDAIIEAVNKGQIHRYINKPWDDNDLILNVRQALEQYELILENKRLQALTKKQNMELTELNKDLEKRVEERSRVIIKKNKELEANLYNTVRAFASLADMTIPELAGHSRRVAVLSREVAGVLNLPKEETTPIEIAALLHDIGKLGLPERLLNPKAKRLSSEDEQFIMKHPEEGQNIVRFIKNLDHVGLLIRSHHEKFDGTGYPDRLSEEMIPVGSRIISVADYYDRSINLRVGKDTLIKEYQEETGFTQDHLKEDEILLQATISQLRKKAFTCFDPDVVKAFLSVIKSKGINLKNEIIVNIDELKEGMKLTRSLYTVSGRFLLPYDTVVTEEMIVKLQNFNKTNPLSESIFVLTG